MDRELKQRKRRSSPAGRAGLTRRKDARPERKARPWAPLLLIDVLSLLLCAGLVAAGALKPDFADAYRDGPFQKLRLPLSMLYGELKLSVGEQLLVLALGLVLALLLSLLLHLLTRMILRGDALPKRFFHALFRGLLRFILGILPGIFLVMTLNCFLLYRCTPLTERLPGAPEHTLEELSEYRNSLTLKLNDLSETLPRGADGRLSGKNTELWPSEMGLLMRRLGRDMTDTPLFVLDGFATRPKALLYSDFVSQQDMMGYFFPFTMEANYNARMAVSNRPFTMCHELAHCYGFIREDEANFLAYLALVRSGDPYYEYLGYLGIYNYVDNDYYRQVPRDVYKASPALSARARLDMEFLSDQAWEEVEAGAVLPTESVKKAADLYVDTTLKANGIPNGKASYSDVVELILQYESLK